MKHILCDVDGVVVHGFHTKPPHTNVWSKNLEADLGVNEQTLIDQFFAKSFMDVLVGKEDLIVELDKVLPNLGYTGKTQDFIDYWFEKDSKINTEFLDWVKDRKDLTFYLATNQEHYRANYLWDNLGLSCYFDSIFYAAKIGYKKPDKEFFEYILNEIKVSPSDICLIDDCPKNIAMAESLGMHGILFNTMDDVLNHPFFNKEK